MIYRMNFGLFLRRRTAEEYRDRLQRNVAPRFGGTYEVKRGRLFWTVVKTGEARNDHR